MSVSEAILTRHSTRAFLDKPVSRETVEHILNLAARAPSGGNLQPWKAYVLTGAPLQKLVVTVMRRISPDHPSEGTEYPIYPEPLGEPYRSRRRKNGLDLYDSLGIAHTDREGRLRQMARNFSFFDAPVGMLFTIDRDMGVAQFVDLGMFMENIMLLARQFGLDTCAQEAWAQWHKTVAEVVNIPAKEMLFCGMALGFADPDAAVNRLETERARLSEFAVFSGFE